MLDHYDLTFKGRKFGLDFELPLNVIGGPFREIMTRIPQMGHKDLTICFKEEATSQERAQADIMLPIKDFSVPAPEKADMVLNTVALALSRLIDGNKVYGGCMGGTGRTGLFFALMAIAAGHKDAVRYVRANYRSHAVETKDQEAYVATFEGLDKLHRDLNGRAFWAWMGIKTAGLVNRVLRRNKTQPA